VRVRRGQPARSSGFGTGHRALGADGPPRSPHDPARRDVRHELGTAARSSSGSGRSRAVARHACRDSNSASSSASADTRRGPLAARPSPWQRSPAAPGAMVGSTADAGQRLRRLAMDATTAGDEGDDGSGGKLDQHIRRHPVGPN
jgi:hypothetical protein